ncbi:MAG: DAK2 domain-containing protein [Actinoallomurus sp.]
MSALTVAEVAALLDRALRTLAEHRDHLRDLDAAVGDGDLGITVARGADAIRAALTETPPDTLGTLLRTSGAAFAKANPSTIAALVGGGLLAAAKAVADEQELTTDVAVRIGEAAQRRIAERGKAELGDKTLLDAFVPSIDALRNAQEGDRLRAMIAAARAGVEATTNQPGRRGRAAWVGERGTGHPDPGATAYLLFLESLQSALTG